MYKSYLVRALCWASVMALLAISTSIVAQEKTANFPEVVYTDADGNWTVDVIITVTNPPDTFTDPDLKIEGSENTTVNPITAVNGLNNSWKYTLSGKLNPGSNVGSVTFSYDPPEVIFVESITIIRSTIPTLTEWGMIIFCVLLFGWMAWVIVRRRRRVTAGI